MLAVGVAGLVMAVWGGALVDVCCMYREGTGCSSYFNFMWYTRQCSYLVYLPVENH